MKLFRLISNPKIIFPWFGKRGFFHSMDDKKYLENCFEAYIGKKLKLNDPKTFNEKLQWLKLYDRNEKYATLVDKVDAKAWAASKIEEKYIIPTIGVYSRFEEIEPDQLPDRFVIKCSHDSGSALVCDNKESFNWKIARKNIERSLKINFYYPGREWPYKHLKPRIIIEDNINNGSTDDLIDYKVMCFNGEAKCLFTCAGRSQGDLRVDFFDTQWNHLPFKRHYKNADIEPSKPNNLVEIISLAERLSEGIPFVRVDFYSIENSIYFGEMTLYPGCGFEEFDPYEWDEKLGEMLNLPELAER